MQGLLVAKDQLSSQRLLQVSMQRLMPASVTRDLELYLMDYYSLFPFLMVLGRVSLLT
jgi:hypothetical protein